MTRQEAAQAVWTGMMLARRAKAEGIAVLGVGEMGIGNTTTSSAVLSCLLELPACETVGRGGGVSDKGFARKREIIDAAITRYAPDRGDPVDVLSKLGGFDIAAMCGAFLGAAARRLPVVVDGYISAVAALCACRIAPACADYLFASHISCERGYVPWPDMGDAMREAGIPLLSLEGAAPVASFDIVGMHVPHEMAVTNFLEALDLAGIPLLAADRTEDNPIIVAGGPSVYNPEPYAAFFDAILIGEGEESLLEICQLHRRLRDEGVSRAQIVEQLATVAGTYVPSLYEVRHDEPCSPHGYTVPREGKDVPPVVYKRVVEDFGATNPLSQSCVPYAQLVHDRLSIEILRGCARGCRFCQAGMTYRPVRERSADQIVSSVIQGLEKTGYDEVSLTSLSTTDHSCIRDVLGRLNRRLEDTGIRVSIPSQRLDSFGVDMAESVAGEKKGGLTFAPEAGSQRMRDIINKNVTEEDLDRAAKAAFEAGWNRMKLYFMMGLPGERDEDIMAIANLADHVLELGRSVVPKARRGSISVSISVSVFIPKAATPFQWCPQLDYDDVKRRQKLLITSVRNRAVRVHYHDAETSLIEAALSRAGRDMTPVVIDAWRSGSRFDAWVEHFSLDNWKEAAAKNGIDLNELVHLPYELDWRLPWEHVSPGCTRGFLEREYRRSLEGVTTPDCTRTSCTGCGICPTLHAKNVLMGDRA